MKNSTALVTVLLILSPFIYSPIPVFASNEEDYFQEGGIGVLIGLNQKGTILSVIPGGPAYLAGLKSGDQIIHIDDFDISNSTHPEILSLLRGEECTRIKLKIRHSNLSEKTVSLTRVNLSEIKSDFEFFNTESQDSTHTKTPTNTMEALTLILKELQTISDRLENFEDRNEVYSSANFNRQGPDRKGLMAISFPENPTKEKLKDYVAKILTASMGQSSYSSSDPQITMLARVGEENINILLDETLVGQRMSNYHINAAIKRIATDDSKALILESLEMNHDLAEVVLQNGWQDDARDTLIAGLGVGYLPREWIEAVVSFQDPSTYDALLKQFVMGSNRSHTFDQIRNLPGIELEESVEEAWKRSRSDHWWSRASMGAVAIEYGHKDALEVLVYSLDSNEVKRNKHIKDIIFSAIRDHTDASESDLENIKNWYSNVKDTLEFDPETSRFVQSSS